MTTSVADIERLAYRSWPAAEVEEVGGWMFRYTPVIDARRLNSATTPVTGSVDVARNLAAVERWFAERSIQPVVRVLSSSDPEIDRFLAASGWDLESVTRTMAKRLDGVTPAPDVRVVPRASADWADTKQRFTGMDPEMIESWLRRSEAIVGDTGFASLDRDGEIACIGLGVCDSGWLGLFDLNTDPGLRRRGLARSIVETLEAWAHDKGMQRAYLQVEASNTAALALYANAGYGPLYDYWYRRRG